VAPPISSSVEDQDLLASGPVADVTEDDPAQWPGGEPDGGGGEGQQGADHRVEVGKNSLLNTTADAVA